MDDFDFDWGLDDYGSDTGSDSTWDTTNVNANSDWTGYDGSSDSGLLSSGANSGSTTSGSTTGNDYWTKWLAQAGLSGAAGYLDSSAKAKASAEDWKAKTQFMKDQMAETEKYYQAHGQQLSDAYSKYAKYYTKPTDHGANNPTALFGMLAPQTPATQAVNGYAFDPEGAYPNGQQASVQPQPIMPQLGHSTHAYPQY